jgi:hypothetical protein
LVADEGRAAYAHWRHESSGKTGIALHAAVFETNYVDLLGTPQEEGAIS